MLKEIKTLIIISIILIIIFFFVYNSKTEEKDYGLGNPETDFLSVRLYDINGNQILIPGTFAIVNNIPGVFYMDYTVMMNNTGSLDLECTLTNVNPVQFWSSTCAIDGTSTMTGTTKTIIKGYRASWTSKRMYVPGIGGCDLSAISPITITASVNCYYYEAQVRILVPGSPKTGNITISVILSIGSGDFLVNVTPGGIPTEYCGNGICESFENYIGCPEDC